jgi:hypothetical protein
LPGKTEKKTTHKILHQDNPTLNPQPPENEAGMQNGLDILLQLHTVEVYPTVTFVKHKMDSIQRNDFTASRYGIFL